MVARANYFVVRKLIRSGRAAELDASLMCPRAAPIDVASRRRHDGGANETGAHAVHRRLRSNALVRKISCTAQP